MTTKKPFRKPSQVKEDPETKKRFDEALKRVWSTPPQHKTAKKEKKK